MSEKKVIVNDKDDGKKKIVKRKKEVGKHSSPETSGIQNLPKSYIDRVSNTGGGKMKDLLEMYKEGSSNEKEYKGLWDEESLEKELEEFFEFCAERDIKPAKAGVRLWLGISRSQYWEWENEKGTYKSKLLRKANAFMEMECIGKIEKYPTGNIFLLKSAHGHSDKQEVEITNKSDVTQDNIDELVSKMGLGKKE